MEIEELGHLVLYVRDLDTSVGFCRDVLGFRPITPGVEGMRLVGAADHTVTRSL